MAAKIIMCNMDVMYSRLFSAFEIRRINFHVVPQFLNIHCRPKPFPRWLSSASVEREESPLRTSEFGETSNRRMSAANRFKEFASSAKVLSSAEWEELRRKAETEWFVSKNNFTSQSMLACAAERNYSLGHSLINWTRISNETPNLVTLAKYLRLCADCRDECDEASVLEVYEEIQRRQSVFDVLTVVDIVHGLCRTKRWRESLSYVESVSITCNTVPLNIYEDLAMASFEHGHHDFGWTQLEEVVSRNADRPIDGILLKWMESCCAADESDQSSMVERLLAFIRDHGILVSRTVAEEIKYWFEGQKNGEWNGTFTYNTEGGVCHNCGSHLEDVQLSDSDFEELKSSFISRVIEGADIYLKTNPYELDKFKRFVARTAPYSVVIDGLNIAFTQAKGSFSNARLAEQLLSAVLLLNKNGADSRRPMILGRHHMGSWPKVIMKRINELAHLFFADDLSKDDPFMIYAAMYSGQGTFFVSKDMLRDHLFCLQDNRLKLLFRRWQKGHQLQLVPVNRKRIESIRFKAPLRHNHAAQVWASGWHIPYDDGKSRFSYEMPNVWLCLSDNNESQMAGTISARSEKLSKINVKNIFKESPD